jgi:O-methyltransferase
MNVLSERIEGSERKMLQLEVSHSLCTAERLRVIADHVIKCADLPGEFWEMGVYLGGSASLIGKIARSRPLRIFDSFEGVSEPGWQDMPKEDVGVDGPMWKGEWHGDLKRALINIGRDCLVHKGWIPETFAEVPADVQVAFAHVDVDLYEPTKASLEFILPRLSPGGFIVVDDFDYPRHPGIRAAIEELVPKWPKLKGRVETYAQVVLRLEE